jgi:hypothetical protein
VPWLALRRSLRWASYEHVYELVRAHGEAGWMARLVPLTVDRRQLQFDDIRANEYSLLGGQVP